MRKTESHVPEKVTKMLATLPKLELPFAIVIVFSYTFLTECGIVEIPPKATGHLFSIKST